MLARLAPLSVLGLLATPVAGQVSADDYNLSIRSGVNELFHGAVEDAIALLDAANVAWPDDMHVAVYLAMTHARAGDAETALTWLERSAERGYPNTGWVEGVTFFDDLEDHPRYVAALETMRRNRDEQVEDYDARWREFREQRAASRASWEAVPVQWNDGHPEQVNVVDLSPDGTRAVTVGNDRTVRLWDAWLGESLAVNGPYTDADAWFVDDGERYVVYDRAVLTVDLHDGRSGELITPLHAADEAIDWVFEDASDRIVTIDHRGVVRAHGPFATAPAEPLIRMEAPLPGQAGLAAGRVLWTHSHDGGTRAHDLVSGQLLGTLGTHSVPRTSLYVTPETDAVWFEHLDGHVRRWELGADQPTTEIAAHPWPKAFVAPEGNRLALTTYPERRLRLYDLASGEQVELAGGAVEGVGELAWGPDGTRLSAAGRDCTAPGLWDAETGEPLADFRSETTQMWFSPDGAELVTEWNTATGVLDRWDATTGAALGRVANGGSSVFDVSFGGGRVAFGALQAAVIGSAGDVPLVDHAHPTVALAIDAKGRVGVSGAGLRVWDLGGPGRPPELVVHHGGWWTPGLAALPDGSGWLLAFNRGDRRYAERATRPTRTNQVGSKTLAVSPSGERYASCAPVATGMLGFVVDIASGEIVAEGPAPYPTAGLLRDSCTPAFDPTGELVVTPDETGALRVWTSWDGEELAVARGHTGKVRHLVFDPTGRYLASSAADWTVRLWNAGDFSPHAVLSHDAPVHVAAFSPDGALVATAADTKVALFDTATGERRFQLDPHIAAVQDVELDPSGTRLVTASADGTARIFDVASGGELAVLRSSGLPVRFASFTPDSKRVVTVGRDAAAHVFDAESGALLASLVTYDDEGWLAFTPGGHYVGSDNAADWTRLVLPRGSFPLSSYESVLNDPAAVAAAVAGDVPPRPFLPEAPELDLIWPESGVVNQREFELDARIEDRYGIEHVAVHVGGVEVSPAKVTAGLRLDAGGRRGRLNLKLSIPATMTSARVTVRAENARRVLSKLQSAELVYEAPRKRLFLLALGVGDYEEPSLRLGCPANDARDLAEAFAAQEGSFYDEVLVETLTDDAVTPSAVERLRSRWLLQAGPDDTIVVFVAGHGVQDDSGEYWFLTPQATADDPYSGINRSNLTRLVTWNKLKTPRRLLMIDTCHSGDAFDATRGEGITPFYSLDDVAALSEDEGAGIYVMAASAESELAREQEGNGLFTRAVLDALAGAADRAPHGNEDGFVDVEEVVRFAKREVHERSGGRQMPTMPEVRGGENFRLTRVP